MSDALAKWRERSMFDVTAPSGTVYTCQLPDVQECLIEGDIPMPLLNKLATVAQKPEEATKEAAEDASGLELLRHMRAFNRRLVIRMVRKIDGEDVTLDDELLSYMTPEDFEELRAIANREKDPVGKA